MNAESELDRLFRSALEQIDSPEERELVAALQNGTDSVRFAPFLIEEPEVLIEEPEGELQLQEQEGEQDVSDDIHKVIAQLSVPEKIKLALKGNKTVRMLLLRDSNRDVPLFVLQNPRISDGEVEDISRMTTIDDSVLRSIGNSRVWMKNYGIKVNLVSNPKTPLDLALRWIKFLQDKDLRRLSGSKNVPQVVAIQCRKMMEKRTKDSRQ